MWDKMERIQLNFGLGELVPEGLKDIIVEYVGCHRIRGEHGYGDCGRMSA